jgi:hypothetical protein
MITTSPCGAGHHLLRLGFQEHIIMIFDRYCKLFFRACDRILGFSGQLLRSQGSGFRKSTRAGAMVFAILPHGRLGLAAIGFGQLLLKGTFHAIEHPDALLISGANLCVSRPGFIAFQMRYIKMMKGLRISLLNPLYLSYFLGAAAALEFASLTRAL